MGPAEIALGLILAVVIVSFYLQVRDRQGSTPSFPPAPPAPEYTVEGLKAMTKAELLELASSKGLNIPSSWNKSRILATLIENLT